MIDKFTNMMIINYDIDTGEYEVRPCPKDGTVDCESQYCYDNNCLFWNPDDNDDMLKSDYDENREFIDNLNPNDPADAWFFED